MKMIAADLALVLTIATFFTGVQLKQWCINTPDPRLNKLCPSCDSSSATDLNGIKSKLILTKIEIEQMARTNILMLCLEIQKTVFVKILEFRYI